MLVIGHRGSTVDRPENTMPSFARALEAGADGFEFDVQLSADGAPVVIHDETVDRTTDGSGSVAGLEAAGLRRLDAGSWFDPVFAGLRLPLLDELLAEFSDRCTLNLELKTEQADPALVERCLAAVSRHAALETVVFSSFSWDCLQLLRERSSAARVGVLYVPDKEEGAFEAAATLGAATLHPHVSAVDKKLMARCHKAGLDIWTWNANDEAEVRRLRDLGVAAVFSDDPAAAVAALTN